MSERRASLPPPADELAAVRQLVAPTVSQISIINALLATLAVNLKNSGEKRQELEAELATRRQSLLEWMQSKDLLSKTLQDLTLRAQSHPPVVHIQNLHKTAANPTATPSDGELAQRLAGQEKNDIESIRMSMDTREATISVLRSRIAVLEDGIAGCEAASSHIKSMVAFQDSNRDQLKSLLRQYKSRLHPLLRLPDTCLQGVFLHVVWLCWEQFEDIILAKSYSTVSTYGRHPALALAAVCHRWRELATHTPELWSKIMIGDGPKTHLVARLVHYIRHAKDRTQSIATLPWFRPDDPHLLRVIKSSNVKLDTLGLILSLDRQLDEQILRILPPPRVLALQDYGRCFPVSIPQEHLSRMEELRVLGCQAIPTITIPTLRRLELDFRSVSPSTPLQQYVTTLLQRLPQLDYLSIQCYKAIHRLGTQSPPLLLSHGVYESVTWLQIPLMALCGPLETLQTSFLLPNLVRLSLLEFFQDGSDIQSWSNFCKLNGGKINFLRLDSGSMDDRIPSLPSLLRQRHISELAEHLQCLAGIRSLSLSRSLMNFLLSALRANITKMKGKSSFEDSLLLPNMEICKIHGSVKTSASMAIIQYRLARWSEARNAMKDEATGRCGVVQVLWP